MQKIVGDLLAWYDRERRDLPWRAAPGLRADPYHVWLSEIMLQQTTVATVKAYFLKFLRLWPTVGALAQAPLDDVLREWAGLGYYARARNLHKCAGIVARDCGGRFPDEENALKRLPGIGDYTAAAITAIAFDKPATVVDGNIERVVSRLHRIDIPLPAAKKPIKAATAAIAPARRPGDFAQAMMDLGSAICTPKNPKCLLCPIAFHCAAKGKGDMEAFPVKPAKKTKPTRRAVSFWLEHEGHVLLERRAAKGLLGGMPGLFSTPWIERADFPEQKDWLSHSPANIDWQLGADISRHTFTHFHLESILATGAAARRFNIENGFWHPVDDLHAVGLPTVFRKITKLKS